MHGTTVRILMGRHLFFNVFSIPVDHGTLATSSIIEVFWKLKRPINTAKVFLIPPDSGKSSKIRQNLRDLGRTCQNQAESGRNRWSLEFPKISIDEKTSTTSKQFILMFCWFLIGAKSLHKWNDKNIFQMTDSQQSRNIAQGNFGLE